ncbi:MAG: recombinase family protein [Comamonadaceae bacterium]|jgi:putative DNA-invertase from lambdoid prophage Rac|uniref:recombinase family protein n=1 Tax=Candidatus Skiveiella danica TaxID=3386177 RepID=UPI003909F971|nr:recombinase family protein [Comamonadaceae bacterium]
MTVFFGYGRVSTDTQSTENQRVELAQAGYQIPDEFWFSDHRISGKTCATQRPQFSILLSKIRSDETLVVSKLDRLGRDAVDVMQTIRLLRDRKVKVIVLQLGSTDLTSPPGKMLLNMLAAVAEMERDLLVERTQAGLQRAKAQGKKLGRPAKTTDEQRQSIRADLKRGISVSQLARQHSVSRATVIGIRESATV